MREIILDRLSKIDDLEQRKLLKNIVTGVFLNLVEYQEEMNRRLEERVFNEIEDWEEKHDVYATLCARQEVDPIHEFLFPMIPEDVEPLTWEMPTLLSALANGEDVRLMPVYLECDVRTLQGVTDIDRTSSDDHHAMTSRTSTPIQPRLFTGTITTTSGIYPIQARLEPNRTYLHEIEKLYHAFQKNNIPWKTVNHPYAHKFFDVILTGATGLRSEDEIISIHVDLEEYEPFKRVDVIPLWNIERLTLKNSGFPIPADDRVNFEHVLPLRKTGVEHGYLVDAYAAGDDSNAGSEPIRYIKRTVDELTIVSPQERAGMWHVWKITQPVHNQIGRLEYELLSNRRKKSFIGKFAQKQVIAVRSKGEILRIVHSFEASKYVELVDIEIRESGGFTNLNDTSYFSGVGYLSGTTYPMNPFIRDQIRVDQDKNILLLRFKPREGTPFIQNEIMSFLVSEVERHVPEYRCEGEWA
ncbi:normocyte-binding protein [Brevibacillus dissolubilis]|uniref:normocyte-binding protein n=1 Tax=Brevibacillus dissolubilis TaxID=1844116 RepID=UPI0011163A0B|nr:normocyte-binding protein [Brevibacillus dissolubilis]